MRPGNGRLIDQAVALCFQSAEVEFDVIDAKAEVMDSFATFLDVFSNDSIGIGEVQFGFRWARRRVLPFSC